MARGVRGVIVGLLAFLTVVGPLGAAASPVVFLAPQGENRIVRWQAGGSAEGETFITTSAQARQLNIANDRLFWLDGNSIWSRPLAGDATAERFFDFGVTPGQMTIDTTNNTYQLSFPPGPAAVNTFPLRPSVPGFRLNDRGTTDISSDGGFLYWTEGNSVFRQANGFPIRPAPPIEEFNRFGDVPLEIVVDAGTGQLYLAFQNVLSVRPLRAFSLGFGTSVAARNLTLSNSLLYYSVGGTVFAHPANVFFSPATEIAAFGFDIAGLAVFTPPPPPPPPSPPIPAPAGVGLFGLAALIVLRRR